MIDLSQFVNKNVTVTFRDGTTLEGNISFNDECYFPYKFESVNGLSSSYTNKGRFYVTQLDRRDIIAIEEVKPVSETASEAITEVNYKREFMQIGAILGEAFPECEISTVDMARLVMDQLKTLRMAVGLPTFDQVRNQTNS